MANRRTHRPYEPFEWETRGAKQEHLKAAIKTKAVVFAIGSAGTGKSFVATCAALDELDKGKRKGGVDQFVITRPLVTAGEEFGFLPGLLEEKLAPYLRPIHEIIRASRHPNTQEYLAALESTEPTSQIVAIPIALMRGITFDSRFVLVDESQNLTHAQFELILTRLGHNAKIVFTGDTTQSDLRRGESGLARAVSMFRNDPDVGVVEFGLEDIQRHGFVARAITAYQREREAK